MSWDIYDSPAFVKTDFQLIIEFTMQIKVYMSISTNTNNRLTIYNCMLTKE